MRFVVLAAMLSPLMALLMDGPAALIALAIIYPCAASIIKAACRV